MRIGIITSDPTLESCTRLEKEATRRGHDWVSLPLLRLAIRTSSPRLICTGEAVEPLDAVILRLGAVLPGLAVAAGRALEQDGVALIDPVDALVAARDKMQSLQLLSRAGLPVPQTELVRDLDQLKDAVDRLGGPPVVLKPLFGSQGRGAVLAESHAAAVSMMESVLFLSREFILQRYIECGGQDIRVLLVGGEVVAAMRRTAPTGDFRSNLHRGGVATPVQPTAEMKELALQAASTLGLQCAGVDLLEGPDGFLVLEVNGSPGLAGIESASGVAIASRWIDAIEEKVEEKVEEKIGEGERCEQR